MRLAQHDGIRRCVNCAAEDRVEPLEGEYDDLGRPKVHHLVTVELRWILGAQSQAEAEKRITAHQRSRGWTYKFFQGRHAMQRLVCRVCLRELEIMERDWARKGGKQDSSLSEFYGALCGE